MIRFVGIAAMISVGWAVLHPSTGGAAPPASPPPTNEALKPSAPGAADLEWGGDLGAALKRAARDKQLVFIDFTGVTCLNCKVNEKTVFTKPEVRGQLAGYVRVQLFVDEVPAEFYTKDPGNEKREEHAEANLQFQKKQFGTEQLPLYAIVRPAEGGYEKVAVYDEGRIKNVEAFVEFLKKPLTGGKE